MSPRDFTLLMLICLVWAGNSIVSKMVVTDLAVPPLAYAAVRFLVVLALVFPWLRRSPRPLWLLALTGFLVGGGQFGFAFIGLKTASPSSAAVVSQLGAPMMVALSIGLLGERLTPRRVAGMVLACGGALLVMWDPHGFTLSPGLMWVALSAFCGALGAVLMKTIKAGAQPLQLQAWVAVGSLPPMMAGSLLFEPAGLGLTLEAGWPMAAAVAYSAIVVSVFAHTLFYGILRRYDASLIGPLTLTAPVMTILLGILITHDRFDSRMAMGTLAALGGVLLIGLDPRALTAGLRRLRSRGR